MIHRLHSIQINQAAARRILMVVLLVFVCLQGVPTSLPAQDKPKAPEQAKIEVYAAPTALELKMQLQNWAADQKTKNPAELKSIARLLVKLDSPLSPEQKLALTLQVFSELNPEAKQLVQAYQLSDKLPQLSSHPLLVNGKAETFYLSNIRYYVARNLTQFRMVDQALELFTSIKPDELIDPAGYLFYKAVCEHHLLQKEACGKNAGFTA